LREEVVGRLNDARGDVTVRDSYFALLLHTAALAPNAAPGRTAMIRLCSLSLSQFLLLLQRCILLITVTAVSAWGAASQTPGRAITIVVPYTAGTGPDILARTIGEELHQCWGQSVVVENKPGASGNIGTQFVARAMPDGHTLLITANPFTANISLLKSVPYDPVKGFMPIIEVATGTLALALHP
jgi:tripartite-type tricarboxylate transporter receptor subunit TctC